MIGLAELDPEAAAERGGFENVRCGTLPTKKPNLSAYAEHIVRSIKSECLDRMIFFGGKHLRCVVNEYVERCPPSETIRALETD